MLSRQREHRYFRRGLQICLDTPKRYVFSILEYRAAVSFRKNFSRRTRLIKSRPIRDSQNQSSLSRTKILITL